jgi:aspartate/methionine/tyrosine aminotransferase
MPHRSRRIPEDLSANRLAAAMSEVDGIAYDLTITNPTAVGLESPVDLLGPLAAPGARVYSYDPRGPLAARAAVAAGYRRWGVEIEPRRVVLTASTSEAYSFLFRLLADPGDEVLVPSPSYPLFDQLARLDGIEAVPYALDSESRWRLDLATMAEASDRVRAMVVVHPNNPTGSYVHPEDAEAVVALCRERGWALIADEVFLPYPLDGGHGADRSFAAVDGCLCFALGGLSKSIGQPQLKLSWIVVSGPSDEVDGFLEGLEYVTDAFLSVSTPVAVATPVLLQRGRAVRDAIHSRCRTNLESFRRQLADSPAITVGPVGGGWSAVLRVPAIRPDEELCIELLETEGVAVHPGLYFGFPRDGYLVISLLTDPGVLKEGVRRLLRFVDRLSG